LPDEGPSRVSSRERWGGTELRRRDSAVVRGQDGTIANSNAMRYYPGVIRSFRDADAERLFRR
jgi:hypothetical protein